jgi:predicted CopG family antitoxin
MGQGYKNKLKRSDSFSDVIPSYKRNKEADQGEIFVSRETEKVSFKKGINNIVQLENEAVTPIPPLVEQSILDKSVALNGFRLTSCINEDITLPDNVDLEFTGPLEMCAGKTITVPSGTILTIV